MKIKMAVPLMTTKFAVTFVDLCQPPLLCLHELQHLVSDKNNKITFYNRAES